MSFKCELCGGKTKKIYEDERKEFWKCEKHHIVKEVKYGKEHVRNVNGPVFMVAKPKRLILKEIGELLCGQVTIINNSRALNAE